MSIFTRAGRTLRRGITTGAKAVGKTAVSASRPFVQEATSAGKALGSAVSKEGQNLISGIKKGDVKKIAGTIMRVGGSIDNIADAVTKSKIFSTVNEMSGGALATLASPLLEPMRAVGKKFDEVNTTTEFLRDPTKQGFDRLVQQASATGKLPAGFEKQYNRATDAIERIENVRKLGQTDKLQATRMAVDELYRTGQLPPAARKSYEQAKLKSDAVRDIQRDAKAGRFGDAIRKTVEATESTGLKKIVEPIIEAVENKNIRPLGQLF
jgi:hypothetical protein